MIITCEACNTSFNLDEKMLKPEGSKVRCSVCAKVFTAFPKQVSPSEPVKDIEALEPLAVEPEIPVKPEGGDETATESEMVSQDLDADFFSEEELGVEALKTEMEEAVGDTEEEQKANHSELDAELDLFFDTDVPDESDATVIVDLDDDDLDLSVDSQPDKGELGFSDLDEDDFDLDAPFVSGDDPEGTETIIADLDDGSLDFDDDLDLSDLENMLQVNEKTEKDGKTIVVDNDGTELSFDLEEDFSVGDENENMLQGDSLDELELELESDKVVDGDDTGSDDQEMDLSEIEKMLEDHREGSVESSTVPEQDLGLDVDDGLDSEKWMAKATEEDMQVQDEEIDLAELEQVLEDVDLDAEQPPTKEPELALDIQDAEDQEVQKSSTAGNEDLELDFPDFEDNIQFVDDETDGASETGDMELKFEVETDRQAEQTLEDEALVETVAVSEPEPKASEIPALPPEPVGDSEETPVPEPVKKGANKFLVFLLIVIFLGGGGYGAFYILNQQGIDIPFLGGFLKPKVDDPGNIKLSTYEIDSKFVDNVNVGKLFVISGKVKNGYSDNRGMVTLNGKLFSKGKTLVYQEKVYCGNIMSDLELANLEWEKIKARLSNRLGDNRSNVKIAPGESIPFMIIFSRLPDDLEEFTIEVTGSTVLK